MVRSYKNDEEQSTGTGFIYKKDEKYGYVITNQHVVSGSDKVELVLSDELSSFFKEIGVDLSLITWAT